MATNNSAEIVQMDEARAKRRSGDGQEFENAGAQLRAAREAAGLSIDDIAERTHIKAAFLTAIEDMDTGRLPHRPFVIGFVTAYAQQLRLSPQEIVARFKDETQPPPAAPTAEPEHVGRIRPAEPELDRPEMSLWAAIAILAFVIVCVVAIVTRSHRGAPPYGFGPQVGPSSASAGAGPAPAEAVSSAIYGLPSNPAADYVEAAPSERVTPVYPQRCEESAAPHETVIVAFNVSSRGTVSDARVASSTNTCFNQAAIRAIVRWRFTPRTVNGAPTIAADMRYSFVFNRPS